MNHFKLGYADYITWINLTLHCIIFQEKTKDSYTHYWADPGVQAVSPQVTISHPPGVGCHYFLPGLRLPSQQQSITAPWPVPSYTAWWQRHIGVNNLPKVVTQLCPEYRIWTHELLIASPTLYPLHHRAIILHCINISIKKTLTDIRYRYLTTRCCWVNWEPSDAVGTTFPCSSVPGLDRWVPLTSNTRVQCHRRNDAKQTSTTHRARSGLLYHCARL